MSHAPNNPASSSAIPDLQLSLAEIHAIYTSIIHSRQDSDSGLITDLFTTSRTIYNYFPYLPSGPTVSGNPSLVVAPTPIQLVSETLTCTILNAQWHRMYPIQEASAFMGATPAGIAKPNADSEYRTVHFPNDLDLLGDCINSPWHLVSASTGATSSKGDKGAKCISYITSNPIATTMHIGTDDSYGNSLQYDFINSSTNAKAFPKLFPNHLSKASATKEHNVLCECGAHYPMPTFSSSTYSNTFELETASEPVIHGSAIAIKLLTQLHYKYVAGPNMELIPASPQDLALEAMTNNNIKILAARLLADTDLGDPS